MDTPGGPNIPARGPYAGLSIGAKSPEAVDMPGGPNISARCPYAGLSICAKSAVWCCRSDLEGLPDSNCCEEGDVRLAEKLREFESSFGQYEDRINELLMVERPVAVRASVSPFGIYSLPASMVMDTRERYGDDAAWQVLYTFLLVNDYSKPATFFTSYVPTDDAHFGLAYYDYCCSEYDGNWQGPAAGIDGAIQRNMPMGDIFLKAMRNRTNIARLKAALVAPDSVYADMDARFRAISNNNAQKKIAGFPAGGWLRAKRACYIAKMAGLAHSSVDLSFMRCQEGLGSHAMLKEHYGNDFPHEQCTVKLQRLAAILGWSMAKVENGLCEMKRPLPPTDYFFPRQRIWIDA